MESFDELLGKISDLWRTQSIKAKEADALLEECEVLEDDMISLLRVAEENYPEDYKEYLQSFDSEIPRLSKEGKNGKN
ncbi:MAG: hypothetical protein M0R38_12245 [Bacteroidia bacterium]|nr:hypothetical protein [Bacteroidia bacterium]